ncbi:SpdD-like protein [Streptomyces sp. RKND-216]|uniref:SpdD-like protein n=1 Tax=Streptomyces sp. RKND-216 TaxID=2562581 RepID=UPI00109DB345|nr:SpdD-like protein [Streptomyces sp. RKND-216]THA25089.1 SpdD-like protein [Streptomyces sp. RKND-216]
MFRPKYPTTPAPTGNATRVVAPTTVRPGAPIEPTGCDSPAPTNPPANPAPAAPARITPGTAAALVAGGTAAVLVVGTVLVSMLLAVAITAASLAVTALVIRSLLHGQHQR